MVIGDGAFGRVVKAKHRSLGEVRAIKSIPKEVID